MAHPINMPQVGQDIETAVITEWKVKVGDYVEKGDVVALVESDKAVFEVEAFEEGTILQLLFEADEEACVLEPIAIIGREGEDPGTVAAPDRVSRDEASAPGAEGVEPPAESPPGAIRISASPSARRLAAEMAVNLERLKGSGPQGRIIKEDVLKAVGTGNEKGLGSLPVDAVESLKTETGNRVIPFSRMRQSIADRLTRSVQNIPHFYLAMKADVTEFLAWREQRLDDAGNRISVNALAVKATASSLLNFPRMNAHVAADSMTLFRQANIGIAVTLEEGLIVPVIPDASSLNLEEIAVRIREISESARRLVMAAGPPGTFTVSNLGMVGVSEFFPIINPPEAGILGIGAVEKRLDLLPGGKVVARDMLPLTLGCDHRAVDGFYAGQFLQSVREEIEKIELGQTL